MTEQCECRTLEAVEGRKAREYANRYLSDASGDEPGAVEARDEEIGRLMRCRLCGAYWDVQEVSLSDEGSPRLSLRRIHSAESVEDLSQAPVEEE